MYIDIFVSAPHPNVIYGAATVMEEVDLRGAKTSAEVVNPDIGGEAGAGADVGIETARENDIPLQFSAIQGGATDGGQIHLHRVGVPTVVIGVAARHIHSHGAIIHRDDYDHTLKLVTAVVAKLDEGTVAGLTG